MQSDSSANFTCSEFASAVEWTATVSMPSSRAARMIRSAISARFAMRILWNISVPGAGPSDGLEPEKLLSVFDRASVLDQRLQQASRLLGLDLVHQLHRLHDAEHLPLLHHLAHLHERRVVRRGGAVEGADEGGVHRKGVVARGGGGRDRRDLRRSGQPR